MDCFVLVTFCYERNALFRAAFSIIEPQLNSLAVKQVPVCIKDIQLNAFLTLVNKSMTIRLCRKSPLTLLIELQ